MTMEMFLEELRTAVKTAAVNKNLKVDGTFIDNDQLTLNIRTGIRSVVCMTWL